MQSLLKCAKLKNIKNEMRRAIDILGAEIRFISLELWCYMLKLSRRGRVINDEVYQKEQFAIRIAVYGIP